MQKARDNNLDILLFLTNRVQSINVIWHQKQHWSLKFIAWRAVNQVMSMVLYVSSQAKRTVRIPYRGKISGFKLVGEGKNFAREKIRHLYRHFCHLINSTRLNCLNELLSFTTISDLTLLAILVIYRFSKIEVRAKKWILGYLFNLVEYFNLGRVGRLPGHILSFIRPFLNFWIVLSLKSSVKTQS